MAKQYDVQHFKVNLSRLCEGRGDQLKLAEAAGISVVFLNRLLKGKSLPSLETAARLAMAVDRPLDELLTAPRKDPTEKFVKVG